MLTRRSDHFKAFIITFVMRLYIFMRCTNKCVFTEYNVISQRAVYALFLFIFQNEEFSRGMVEIDVLGLYNPRDQLQASCVSERTALKVWSFMLCYVMLYSPVYTYSTPPATVPGREKSLLEDINA